ncbi:DUF2786 domain-containing protein [Vibrio scophthalmi]|uniref:DUF2786 domain-containing protein n=1 Tax=Vibrio scophthalmi TaxID=45658 RepID=UPI003AAB7908
MTAFSKTIDKIKKLLRLAKSSNPHEAGLALERAQRLMIVHNIGIDSPELNGVRDETITLKLRAKTPPAYIAGLFNIIKLAFGCDGYFKPTWTHMKVVFIGHDHRPEVAGYAFTVLERQLTIARREYLSSLNKRMKRANKTARADQFCEGWIIGVKEKVQAFVLSEDEKLQLENFKNQIELNQANVRSASSSSIRSADARFKGYQAAKEVVLNNAVSGTEINKLEAL